ncbi:predicted protein [Naegleria gruberi]|uniref:Predicted protein n=1 Tax=Naegleria gruberi TaxID=5762 RepID=D2W454_NAEGR|nr:uncharacterized protein NAEGRDRAFT_76184 [Naegleria gruberi]EFC36152.1 predicted protein [Naegleria gruberi]|eukprot:XP_002668896.1 predicted protein [Naegleria gruberi strain NEG-M]
MTSTIAKRQKQADKIQSTIDGLESEVDIIGKRCKHYGGEDCDIACAEGRRGYDCLAPVCDSKCSICESPGNCSQCSTNHDGATCSLCKTGWTGATCSTPVCDSKCTTCGSPSVCSVCSGNYDGTTCSICKTGWSGITCSTPVCDSKCTTCASPGVCSVCSGNWQGSTCSTCKTGWTGATCSTPICDSKCTTCASPGQCSVCSAGWTGATCSTPVCDSKCTTCTSPGQCSVCSSGWTGATCSTPVCDSKCTTCTSPGVCSVCSGNWDGPSCSVCKTSWTGSSCNLALGDFANSPLFSASYGARLITSILSGVMKKTPTRLYRAMGNGYHPYAFHNACNGYSSTVTIVKTSAGAVFGAYLSIPWEDYNAGDIRILKTFSDPNAFLFSMVTSSGVERFVKLGYSGAVGQTVTYNFITHPLFGASDIYLGQGMSFQPAPDAYSKPATFQPLEPNWSYGTTYSFTVSDYEVYSV